MKKLGVIFVLILVLFSLTFLIKNIFYELFPLYKDTLAKDWWERKCIGIKFTPGFVADYSGVHCFGVVVGEKKCFTLGFPSPASHSPIIAITCR